MAERQRAMVERQRVKIPQIRPIWTSGKIDRQAPWWAAETHVAEEHASFGGCTTLSKRSGDDSVRNNKVWEGQFSYSPMVIKEFAILPYVRT